MFNIKGYAPCPRPLLAPCGYQKLLFGVHFGTLGISGLLWRTMEEAGRARGGVQNKIFMDFGSISGLCFNAFWALRLEISILFGLVSRSLIAPTSSVEIWTPGALENSFVWPKTHFHKQQHRTDDC